jgi:hypothetical protein
MPLVLLLSQEVEHEAVAAVGEDVEATVGEIRTNVDRVASKKTKRVIKYLSELTFSGESSLR